MTGTPPRRGGFATKGMSVLYYTNVTAEFWGTESGRMLALKLVAVTAMLIVSVTHDFILGPAAGRAVPGSPGALVLRRRAALLARANALTGVVVVIAAVRLARGG